MRSVFLGHSSVDKPFVRNLAEALEEGGQIKVWIDEGEIAPGDNIIRKIGECLESDFVLFVLSPDSVASNWVKEEWTDAFWEQTNKGQVKLAGALYRDCAIPRLMRNKKYFDLRLNHPAGFRESAVGYLASAGRRHRLLICCLRGRRSLLDGKRIWTCCGSASNPVRFSVSLAWRGAARLRLRSNSLIAAQKQFESVYWLACESGSLPSIAGDFAHQLGLSISGDINQIVAELKLHCGRKRCLLILENVEHEVPGALIPGGQAAVLVTTRQPGLRFLRLRPELRLDLFTEEQCFELFREVLGGDEVAAHRPECRKLFGRVGRLPMAVSVSASLIKYDVRHTIASLAAKLPADVTALIAALQRLPRSLAVSSALCLLARRRGFGLTWRHRCLVLTSRLRSKRFFSSVAVLLWKN